MLSLLSSRQFTPFYGCFKKNFVFSPFFSHSLKCQSRPKLDSNLSLATVLSEGRTNIFSFIFIVKVLSEAELSAISVKRKVPIGDPRVSIPRLVKLAQLFQHYFNYNRNSRGLDRFRSISSAGQTN